MTDLSLSAPMAAAQSKVLRDTYRLLGLTLIPTVLGAVMGTHLGGSLLPASPILAVLVFLGVAFGFIFAIGATRDSAMGVVLLLAFTGFMGLMMGPLLSRTLDYQNGAELVMLAAGGTAMLFFTLSAIARSGRFDFTGMGTFLLIGAVMLLVAGVANVFLQIPTMSIGLSVLAVAIFSGFLLHDTQRIVTGGETNYVMATLGVYLSLFNIFTNLLQLLGVFGGED